MPLVTLVTNVPEEKLGADINQRLNRALADAIPKKPYELFAIHVQSTKYFTFGGTDEPAAKLDIRAFEVYSPEQNKVYSAHICKFLESLGIPATRVLIYYGDCKTSEIGFNHSTVEDLIKTGKLSL